MKFNCFVYHTYLLIRLRQVLKCVTSADGEPRDAAAVVFGLKFADNIHYKCKSS